MINLSAGILPVDLLGKPATLISPGGTYVEGIWTPAPPNDIPIQAVIQAASQKDLIQYADHEQRDGYVTIWTRAELDTVDADAGENAQIVTTPEGDTYRIVKAGRRNEAGFTRAIGRLSRDRGRSV
jgi:hypothetical protein